MSETKPTEEGSEREPTQEEIAAYKASMQEFYKEQIEFLKPQKEYECLMADIEEARLKRATCIIRYAQLTAPPPKKDSSEEKTERPLKKV